MLFGKGAAAAIAGIIGDFIVLHSGQLGKPRKHLTESPEEIMQHFHKVNEDAAFQSVQSELLQERPPEIRSLRKLYGTYSEAVLSSFRSAMEFRLTRKSGLSSTCHYNAVGAVTGALGLDANGDNQFASIAALHDSIEDLLPMVTLRSKDRAEPWHYEVFLHEFIPVDLQPHVALLTNHYDLILSFINRRARENGLLLSKKLIATPLESIFELSPLPIRTCCEKMAGLLQRTDLEEDFFKEFKWLCYKRLYMPDLSAHAKSENNFRTFQIKAIDLFDNALGRDALVLAARIRNIMKMTIWASEGYKIQSTWAPLNDHVMELQEKALVDAENLIINDLLSVRERIDFAASALVKVRQLKDVLYVPLA
jgi:hypothetical protein